MHSTSIRTIRLSLWQPVQTVIGATHFQRCLRYGKWLAAHIGRGLTALAGRRHISLSGKWLAALVILAASIWPVMAQSESAPATSPEAASDPTPVTSPEAVSDPAPVTSPEAASEPAPTTYNLKEVQVRGRMKGLVASRISTLDVETINQAELCKAACCNLSESFETNPSVDVNYSDALTGAKQIKLLGLSGTYVQLLSEGVPFIRGLAAPYGLSYVPGPWMESIQVSKGAGSVINGYEAITGQINVEYKKPATSDRLSLNLFMADNLRTEFNADAAFKVTPYLSTSTFVHYENETKEHDGNNDGFSDLPAVEQLTLFNRWYYQKDGYTSQAALKLMTENRQSGQIDHDGLFSHTDPSNPTALIQPYRIGIDTRRAELFTKNGYVFNPATNTSLGLILSASVHDQQGFYGLNQYDARQDNLYANLIFQTDFNAHHKLVAGSSLLGDRLNESLLNQLATTSAGYPAPGGDVSLYDPTLPPHVAAQADADRTEWVPGVFAEYALTVNERVRLLAGLRYDHSSRFGGFVTPRLHLKYDIAPWWHLRGSLGKGYRTTNLLAENSYLLSSSRRFDWNGTHLQSQEAAWNKGLSTHFYIPVNHRDLTLSFEWYNTSFDKQLLADVDSDPGMVYFYNLQGTSFSTVYQVEANYELFTGLEITAALRYTDARSTYNANAGQDGLPYVGVLRERPLNSRYKGLFAASWQSPLKRWQFDTNVQFNGDSRLPYMGNMSERRSPAYTLVNAQGTRYFRWGSIYVGGENLTNYKQANPILTADHPWSPGFDATQVWGPIHGTKLYVGLRYFLAKK